MRIAFASNGKGMESTLSPHFGRCQYYIFVDIENNKIKNVSAKENPFFNRHEPGAVPKFIANEKSDVIIAGGMGYAAIEWFEKLKVKPITTSPRKVEEVLKDYMEGKLQGAESCSDK